MNANTQALQVALLGMQFIIKTDRDYWFGNLITDLVTGIDDKKIMKLLVITLVL